MLNPNEKNTIDKESNFAVNTRPKEGLFVYSTKSITDEMVKDFLISAHDWNIAKFSITNAFISDIGVTYIA